MPLAWNFLGEESQHISSGVCAFEPRASFWPERFSGVFL